KPPEASSAGQRSGCAVPRASPEAVDLFGLNRRKQSKQRGVRGLRFVGAATSSRLFIPQTLVFRSAVRALGALAGAAFSASSSVVQKKTGKAGQSSEVCSPEHQPLDSRDYSHLMKVDYQAEGHIEQLHVTQQLCLVNWQDLFHRLDLDEQAVFH